MEKEGLVLVSTFWYSLQFVITKVLKSRNIFGSLFSITVQFSVTSHSTKNNTYQHRRISAPRKTSFRNPAKHTNRIINNNYYHLDNSLNTHATVKGSSRMQPQPLNSLEISFLLIIKRQFEICSMTVEATNRHRLSPAGPREYLRHLSKLLLSSSSTSFMYSGAVRQAFSHPELLISSNN